MPGTLKIHTSNTHTSGVEFTCTVNVSGGRGLDTVTIRLSEGDGVAPKYSDTAKAELDNTGNGSADFKITLVGPRTCTFIANATSSAVQLQPDSKQVQVTV